ncbi:hypothetical protein [Bdellovibrio sp. NC01]|uniref:hypothetical protein n=1 Tax=Bdellovibrio sp. NC01 TaxID=2220073 RepID=UPI001AEF7C3E|nr:hypothetical protein [Bdellovibrio sp. NC01]
MLYKLIGALVIISAAAIAFLTLNEEGMQIAKKKIIGKSAATCVQLTPAEQLVKLIDDDLIALGKAKQLPAQWSHIATVEYRNGSELARAILGKAKPGIQRVKEGTAYLEVEIMDLPDEENPGIILQMSLFDIKSKNKIFEIGRTYTMNDLNHQTPPPEAQQQGGNKVQQGQQAPTQNQQANPQQNAAETNQQVQQPQAAQPPQGMQPNQQGNQSGAQVGQPPNTQQAPANQAPPTQRQQQQPNQQTQPAQH